MDITVVVCTYNRSALLKQCLESLEKLIVPEGFSWEALVVDNNSTDGTKAVVEDAQKISRQKIKYFVEEHQGIAYARNRAILQAQGKYIAFIDDDEIADKNWLKSIVETFLKYDCDCVGGKMLPVGWPKRIPGWFTKEIHIMASIFDFGDQEIEWGDASLTPFGGNIAYKKSVLERIGLFDVSLGRRGAGSAAGGEEHDMNVRILKNGGKIIYQPKAVVYHTFRTDFLRKNYYRKINFDTGLKKALLYFGEYKKRNILGIPLFIINQFFRSIIRYIKYIFKNGYNNSFRQELYCWYFLGFMCGRVRYKMGKSSKEKVCAR